MISVIVSDDVTKPKAVEEAELSQVNRLLRMMAYNRHHILFFLFS